MASNTSCPELPPNPFTPMAFLPPEYASQYEISRYLFAVSLGVYVWDIFINLTADYKLLVKCKIRISTYIYYLSRVSTFCFITTSFAFQVAPVTYPQALLTVIGLCYVATISTTSLLFYLRLWAVFFTDRHVRVIFGVLWLATVGSTVTVPVGISATRIGPTPYSIINRITDYTVVAGVVPLIYDTAVFIAVSHRVLSYSMAEDTFGARAKAFMGTGTATLGTLSRALLSSGQFYYFIAICGNVLLVVMFEMKTLSLVAHAMCTVPVLGLTNLLACIVFRKVKFGAIPGDGKTSMSTSMVVCSLPAFKVGTGIQEDEWCGMGASGYGIENTPDIMSYPMAKTKSKSVGPKEGTTLEIVVVRENVHSSR